MNEFTSKKLGEVLAFSRIGTETMDKTREVFKGILGDTFETFESENKKHGDRIDEIAKAAGVEEIVKTKLGGTGDKLRKMRDLYLAKEEDWSNPSEILEWMGFFEGAAVVHWKLVLGAAETIKDETLLTLAREAVVFHENLLNLVSAKLLAVGHERAAQ